jgi:plastocyanin
MNWKALVAGLVVVIIAVVLGLYFGGCFSSSESSAPPPAAAPAPPPPPSASGESQDEKTVEVTMKDIQFMPHEITVPAGGTVRWKNTDKPPHTVTKTKGPGKDFDSGTLQPGATFEQRFERPGRLDYECTIHPGQTGVVNVVK